MQAIKHRYTAVTLCEFDVTTIKEAAELGKDNLYGADLRGADLDGADLDGADLRGADLRGADLRGANLYGADLDGADLDGADLRGANLYGADLRGADLYGAKLNGETLKANPITIQSGLKYFCIISDNYMCLGCKRFTHEDWSNFSDAEISKMDHGALEFWTKWKTPLLSMCESHKETCDKI